VAGVGLPTSPTTSSFEWTLPPLNEMLVFLASAPHPALEVFRERVDDRDAYAVQAAGELVSLVRRTFPPACRRVRISSTPLTFSFG